MTRRHLTTAEAATLAGVSPRMIRHHVRMERLIPVERIGNTMMFRREDVEQLALTIERRWRRPAGSGAPALGVAAFAIPSEAAGTLAAFATAVAGGLVISGVVGLIRDRRADARRADTVPPAGMSWREYVVSEIATSTVHVSTDGRQRVYRACRGEFWRSRFGGWCFYGVDHRVVTVDDPIAIDALEARDRRAALSVVA